MLAAPALAGGACSEEEKTGQLMLAIQTDMDVPKDVDEVVLKVLVAGTPKFEYSWQVGADGLRIPATIGFLAPEDPNATVSFRLAAVQKGRVRTLRKVVTTIPEDRLVTLRLPIQWLCSDEVSGTYDGVALAVEDTLCDENSTCVAGACQTAEVDSATLPEYSPALIFGGGDSPTSGVCFDTIPCLSSGIEVPVDLDSCTIASPGGTQINVGVITTTGEGICDDATGVCYVPIDSSPTVGWFALSEGGDSPSPDMDASVDPGTGEGGASGGGVPGIGEVVCGDQRCSAEASCCTETGSCGLDLEGSCVELAEMRAGARPQGPGAGPRLQLPEGICRRLADNRIRSVVVSTSCATKTQADPPCGPWSSVEGGGGGSSAPPECVALCGAIGAANCEADSTASCMEVCAPAAASCGAQAQTYADCAGEFPFRCGPEGQALNAPECDGQRIDFVECLTGGEPGEDAGLGAAGGQGGQAGSSSAGQGGTTAGSGGNGGSGTVGCELPSNEFVPRDPACQECLGSRCCSEINACFFSDTMCADHYACVSANCQGLADDELLSCADQICWTSPPPETEDLLAMMNCQLSCGGCEEGLM